MTEKFQRDVIHLAPMILQALRNKEVIFQGLERPENAQMLKHQLTGTPIGRVLAGLAHYYDPSETTWAFVVAHTLAVAQSQGLQHQAHFKLKTVLDEASEYREASAPVLASA